MPVDLPDTTRRDALVERISAATIASLELYSVYLGAKLGLYDVLSDGMPRTASELAEDASIDDRYAREWLEQQAVAGHPGGRRRRRGRRSRAASSLPRRPRRRCWLDPDSPAHVRAVRDRRGRHRRRPAAERRGGLPHRRPASSWPAYGHDFRHGAGRRQPRRCLHRPTSAPGCAAMPDLRIPPGWAGGARVADIATAARAGRRHRAGPRPIPRAEVRRPRRRRAVHRATRSATPRQEGVGRSHPLPVPATRRPARGRRPVRPGRLMFEALHDLSRPVEVLAAVRDAPRRPGGAVLVVDERVAETASPRPATTSSG